MQKYNLRDDWPVELTPIDETTNLPTVLFSVPIQTIPLVKADAISPRLTRLGGLATLVIDIDAIKVDILAMTPGVITYVGQEITLTTNIFSVAGVCDTLRERTQQNQSSYPVAWFGNWLQATTIPEKIVYDNIEPVKKFSGSIQVSAGETIGTVLQNPQNPAKKRLLLRFEYAREIQKKSEPYITFPEKCIHPREFLSLLFWNRNCDPILTNSQQLTTYNDPFLQAMMRNWESGSPVQPNFSDVINNAADTWLGLRPPLRTFERVKWESIKEHSRQTFHNEWVGSSSNCKGRILNPFVHDDGYHNYSKCNIIVGEMLFRSGFRTIVWANGGLCAKPPSQEIPYRLKYTSPGQLLAGRIRFSGAIKLENSKPVTCAAPKDKTHELCKTFGRKESKCDAILDQQIANIGAVYLLATTDHVGIIAKVKSCSPKVEVCILDQWEQEGSWVWSKISYARPYKPMNPSDVAIIRLIPGGDPSEDWGQLDLNCVRKVGA